MLKIEVNRNTLLSILQLESRGASQNSELPILSTVLVEANLEKSELSLTSTNLNLAILSKLKAKVVSEGKIALPARITTEFLSSISDETVTLEEIKNLKLKISAKNHQSTIFLLNPEDYPEIPSVSKEVGITISTEELKDAVGAVSFTASKDDTRPVLGGTLAYTTDQKELCLAATDSYRLAERTLKLSDDVPVLENLIIPSQTIQDLLKVIQAQDPQEVSLYAEDDQISFKVSDVTLISRLISGDYPAYKNLIPASSDTNFTVDREELLQSVKVAALFARESAGAISLSVNNEDQKLTINSVANQVGENHSQITVSTDTSGTVNINSRYLIDALNSFKDELLGIRFSKGLAPFIVTPVQKDKNSGSQTHLIMPINT